MGGIIGRMRGRLLRCIADVELLRSLGSFTIFGGAVWVGCSAQARWSVTLRSRCALGFLGNVAGPSARLERAGRIRLAQSSGNAARPAAAVSSRGNEQRLPGRLGAAAAVRLSEVYGHRGCRSLRGLDGD